MLVCVESMSSAMVAPALPMIIPGTTEGTRNFTKASSSGGGREMKAEEQEEEAAKGGEGGGLGEGGRKPKVWGEGGRRPKVCVCGGGGGGHKRHWGGREYRSKGSHKLPTRSELKEKWCNAN